MNRDEDQQPTVEQDTVPKIEPTVIAVIPARVNTAGVIVLQWLSYAFWGWLILALIWLMADIFMYAILGAPKNPTVPYAIATGIVLLPIAFLTDFFYRKHETVKKTGIAMVIMVIHAVLFALLAIVTMIVTVFTGLSTFIDISSNTDTKLVVIFTALGATLLYALTFVRVLNPFKSKKPVFIYRLLMVLATILLLILAIIGPFFQTIATKNDRRIEKSLSSVSREISSYTRTNSRLPASLSQVNFQDQGARLLVQDGLVNYQTETSAVSLYSRTSSVEYRYQLCVTYKEKEPTENNDDISNQSDYPTYLTIDGHAKGQVCYKLSATSY